MNLAAMLALGVPLDYVQEELQKLPLSGWRIEVQKAAKKGINGLQVHVRLGLGGFKVQTNKRKLVQAKHTVHEHRTFADIRCMIEQSQLSQPVKDKALMIFYKLAQAEATVHNMEVDKVHFHEVGALDSIIDIVAAAICYDWLKPARVICSPVQLGGGMVKCQHGLIPVPAPAVLQLLKGVPIKTGAVEFETCTPTGAAILASLVDEYVSNTDAILVETACGIGHRDLEIPNLLRVSLLQEPVSVGKDPETGTTSLEACLLQCNLDDMSGEEQGLLIASFLQIGASDAWLAPIVMKKGRPAVIFSVLCDLTKQDQVTEQLFLQTSTLGVRTSLLTKTMLERSFSQQTTSLGSLTLKTAHYRGAILKQKPEFDQVVELARLNNVSLARALTIINKELNQ